MIKNIFHTGSQVEWFSLNQAKYEEFKKQEGFNNFNAKSILRKFIEVSKEEIEQFASLRRYNTLEQLKTA